MATDKPYLDIPGTTVFDGDQARKGFHLNQFCMSLMKAANRQSFKSDESSYLEQWAISKEQKQAVLERNYTQLIALGGNIYYLVKLSSTDGISVAAMVSTMTNLSPDEYMTMMKNGGRSPDGNRYIGEQREGGPQ